MVLVPQTAQLTASGPRVSTRERWMISGVLAVVAALTAVLVISLATAGPTSSHGCIYITIPAATGAQEIDQCGGTARNTCASALSPGAFTGPSARVVATECRKAGLAVDR